VELVVMDKNSVKEALKKLKETSKKRNFSQTVDLIINLKDLDLKKPEQQVELFVPIHFSRGKKIKIAAFVGPELKDESEKVFDKTIFIDEFQQYADKKVAKKLAAEYSFFIAQANIMPKVAQVFGKFLGSRGKMPNPKAGCVVPPKTAMQPLYERLQQTIIMRAKVQPVIKCSVGIESQNEDDIVDNIMTLYNALIHKLPNEQNNIRNILLKLTMGKPVEVK
jgi:large subunit ribosomal protein L1